MDVKLNTNPLKELSLGDDISYGYYSILIDGVSRGNIWLSDEEIDKMRNEYNFGLIFYDE